MLDENQVIDIICNHLEKQDYTIEQKLHTTEKGIDIIALNNRDGTRLIIEAKGGTSSRIGSNRYGKPYTKSQLFDRVSKGMYTSLKMYSENIGDSKIITAMAFPDLAEIRKLLEPIKPFFNNLGIKIFLAKQNGEVIIF